MCYFIKNLKKISTILTKLHRSLFFLSIIIIFTITGTIFVSCGNKNENSGNNSSENKTGDNKISDNKSGEFTWKDGLTASDIPDFPVKGKINGKDVQFAYINFEKWRGAGDNVINFSLVKPNQNCGFIDDFEGFTLINKAAEIKQGLYIKSKFADDPASYSASFTSGGNKSAIEWNCALEIESIQDKSVKGKIALFFNDASKSWVAGKFDAILCNN